MLQRQQHPVAGIGSPDRDAVSQDLIIGGYYLTEIMDGAKGEGRVFRHTVGGAARLDEGSLDLHALDHAAPPGDRRPSRPTRSRPRPVACCSKRRCPPTTPTRFGHIDELVKKKEMGVIVERLSDNYPKSAVAASLDAIKNLCYRYASQSGLTVSIDDVKTPEGQEGAARRLRGPGRQGREPVPPRHHHRRRAPPAGGPHLDRRHRRGPEGDGGRVQGAAVQPDRHDGRLGRPREHDPDAPDRRHARPRGQPSWRHDPAPDQEELP